MDSAEAFRLGDLEEERGGGALEAFCQPHLGNALGAGAERGLTPGVKVTRGMVGSKGLGVGVAARGGNEVLEGLGEVEDEVTYGYDGHLKTENNIKSPVGAIYPSYLLRLGRSLVGKRTHS